jgi:hypothetical protein
MKLYVFETVPLTIIRSFSLYTHQWYLLYRSVDGLRAESGWNAVSFENKFKNLVHLVGFLIRNIDFSCEEFLEVLSLSYWSELCPVIQICETVLWFTKFEVLTEILGCCWVSSCPCFGGSVYSSRSWRHYDPTEQCPTTLHYTPEAMIH